MTMKTIVGVVVGTIYLVGAAAACGGARDAGKFREVQRVHAGTLDVVLLSADAALHHGKDAVSVEFRSATGGGLVDVGTVKGSAAMSMAGTPMMSGVEVERTSVPGRYEAATDFSMAGTWRTTIEWTGPAGRGSVTFSIAVQ